MTKWDLLIAARERKHFSQGEAAERVNVGLVTYQRWEAGRAKPQPQHMRQLYAVFGSLLDPSDTLRSSEALSQISGGQTALSASAIGNFSERVPVLEQKEAIDEPQAFITAHMITYLLSLAFMEHATCNDKRSALRQAIKDFDTMNPTDKNYQITRREALCSLATLPMITLGLTTPERTIQPTQYGSVLAHCAASLEACWELGKSNDANDITLAFKSASTYLPSLETIARNAPQYRQEALDLAARYALMRIILGRHCVGPTEAIQYAKHAIVLSKETGDISLQLSAYSKLAGTYFFDKKYVLAEKTALEAESLLEQYYKAPGASPLHPCLQGGTYSTLALMQAKNGRSPDAALGKATEVDPGNESYAFMDFKRSSLLLDTGWIYCYQGNQVKAMEALEQRIDPQTFSPKIPQSELGRLETINVMALVSLKTKDRDLEKTIHFWLAGIAGAKMLRSELIFNGALTTYELMEVVWPGEARINDLRDQIDHW